MSAQQKNVPGAGTTERQEGLVAAFDAEGTCDDRFSVTTQESFLQARRREVARSFGELRISRHPHRAPKKVCDLFVHLKAMNQPQWLRC